MSISREKIEQLGFKLVGQVGVNIGCIMIVDPSEILDEIEYQKFMDLSNENGYDYFQMKKGVVVPSGWGDGNYHVYVQENKEGRTLRVLVDFTSTYGFDNNSKEMHDMDMEELFGEVAKNQRKESSL